MVVKLDIETNNAFVGYFRVNYDDTLWQRIINALRSDRKNIHVLNRAQLIDDAFNIARTGRIDYQIAFHLAEYLRYETEYYPWVSALNALSFLSGKLGDDEAEQLLQVMQQLKNWSTMVNSLLLSWGVERKPTLAISAAPSVGSILNHNSCCILGPIFVPDK